MEAIASYPMPEAGMHPRHIAAYQNGNYVYVVMEAGNEVVAYFVIMLLESWRGMLGFIL